MHDIEIENGNKLKCPSCGSIFAIENSTEILYRNITLVYFDTKKNKVEAKCKQCKHMISINFDNFGDKITVIE